MVGVACLQPYHLLGPGQMTWASDDFWADADDARLGTPLIGDKPAVGRIL